MKTGVKHDSNKPPMDLLDRYFLEETAKALGFGANKYGRWNWKKGLEFSRIYGAADRHLKAFNDGENTDPESGLSHLAHAACNIMFLMWMEKNRKDLDDRYKEEK